ncbi:CPBP family intramembrane glutamic endopeptidase [Sphingomonas sp. GB1N7]|uniref:CPBP family intramembrane glutamic endopeptidase n=1 Tax=Parasphingomonas caseinilytica TaxID=3096158 RepID=UPI002FC60D33
MTRFIASRSRLLAAIGLVLALGLAALPLGMWISPGDDLSARIGREAIWWALGAFVLVWIVRVERLPLRSIGLRALRFKGVAWGVIAAIAMMATVMLSYAVIFPALGLQMNMKQVRSLTHVPLWLQTATMVRAGVVEEIIFRGYAIERIAMLTGSRWAGALLSAAAFIAVHISSWGYAQLIVVAFGAAILTALYLYRRDLGSNMLAHFLTDFVGFMLARLQGG